MAMVMASPVVCLLGARASWDTSPTPKPPPPPKPLRSPPPPSQTRTRTAVAPTPRKDPALPSTLLWNNSRQKQPTKHGEVNELYMGLERWLPVAPKVKKARSIYNAASLAYLGDSIYELYARRHFLFPPLSIDVYNERVMSIVRCEAQDALLRKLLAEDYLTEEERDILRWGKNIGSNKTRTRKRAGVAVYSRASSLETLIGYLYLTDMKRLERLMYTLGFSTGASDDNIVQKKTLSDN